MPKDDHPPSFPLYVDDLISDSAVDAMTNEEFGIYMRLLCKAWKERPVGTIPDDDAVLASWAKATRNDWGRCKAGVLRAFKKTIVTTRGGKRVLWKQKRMAREWDKLVKYRKSKSVAGLKGAETRWHSHEPAIGLPMAKNGLSPSPSSSSSSSETNGGDDVDGAKDIILDECARVRERANRIVRAAAIDVSRPDNRSLVAKVALLQDSGELSENDVEETLESFHVSKKPIKRRAAWLHRCLANKCEARGVDFNGLLAKTTIPVWLCLNGATT